MPRALITASVLAIGLATSPIGGPTLAQTVAPPAVQPDKTSQAYDQVGQQAKGLFQQGDMARLRSSLIRRGHGSVLPQ